MPIYEYVCRDCEARFEQLRPAVSMDDPAACPRGHVSGRRVLSAFAALTRGGDGEVTQFGGFSGCGGCGGGCTNCACSLN